MVVLNAPCVFFRAQSCDEKALPQGRYTFARAMENCFAESRTYSFDLLSQIISLSPFDCAYSRSGGVFDLVKHGWVESCSRECFGETCFGKTWLVKRNSAEQSKFKN